MTEDELINSIAHILYDVLGELWLHEEDGSDKVAIGLIKEILKDVKNPEMLLDRIKDM